jgi:DNA-binding HxlR family transcriptional regulator
MYELERPETCSIGRAMEILGERWTFLILRESFYGVRRFSDMQRNLGIARNILSARLQNLVRAGILERRRYQAEPERYEYKLTDTGLALYPAIITIMRWGDDHLVADGPPVVLRHTCGAEAEAVLVCAHCHEPMDPRDVTPVPGPGAAHDDHDHAEPAAA